MYIRSIINRSILSLGLAILTAGAAFSQKVIRVDSSHVTILRIDPSNANGGGASDIFQEINFIPLETTPESLFGSISQLEIVDDYYIILDNNTNCILLFDKKGKFHTKIKGNVGRNGIWRFLVDKWNKQIVYSIDNFHTVNYCDFNGKLIKQLNVEKAKMKVIDFFFSTFIAPNKQLSYFTYYEADTTSKNRSTAPQALLKFINNETTTAVALPYGKAQSKILTTSSGNTSQISNFGNDTTMFFAKPYENNIYTVTPSAIKLSYKLIFPALNILPNDFTTNTAAYPSQIEYLDKHNDLIYNITNCFKTGDNLLFRANSYHIYNEDNLIYNLKSGSLIAYRHIGPDNLSFMLPVYDAIGNRFNDTGLAACDGKYIYTGMSSLCMFKNRDATADQKVKYNAVLTEYFSKSTQKDNPVILQLKLKDQF